MCGQHQVILKSVNGVQAKSVICSLSYSGNTDEVADIIENQLKDKNIVVDRHVIGVDAPLNHNTYDLIFIGTFTWEHGSTPDEVKDFVLEIGCKPKNIHIFGTGDTQFGGDDLFCAAASKLAKFYETTSEPLKIEQSPRGSQEQTIIKWVNEIIKKDDKNV